MEKQIDQLIKYMETHHYFSALDVTKALGFGDIRKKISVLRKKGFVITDEWTTSPRGRRYKVYHYEGVAS